jgi:chromosome partitioning protein
MHVVVFASRKGGSGKSTLAGHLAVEAHKQGVGLVGIIDLDPMGSLSAWYNARVADDLRCFRVERGLRATIEVLRASGEISLVVIDTPPAASKAIANIIGIADIVVVPVVPSPHDLRAISETLDMVEESGRPLEFVLNLASTNGILTHQAASELSQHGTVAPVIVRSRQDYKSSMSDGRTVSEIKQKGRAVSKSVEEMRALWQYLEGKLKKQENSHGRTTSRS